MFSGDIGRVSLSILKLGGGVPMCYQISYKKTDAIPPELEKNHGVPQTLYNFLSIGKKIYVSLEKNNKRIFSSETSKISSESVITKLSRNDILKQPKACQPELKAS